jgi:hypothetical protein
MLKTINIEPALMLDAMNRLLNDCIPSDIAAILLLFSVISWFSLINACVMANRL